MIIFDTFHCFVLCGGGRSGGGCACGYGGGSGDDGGDGRGDGGSGGGADGGVVLYGAEVTFSCSRDIFLR